MTTKTIDGEEYIKKSDVLAVMQSEIKRLLLSYTLEDIVWKFDKLPTIEPIKVLEEMIEEDLNSYDKSYYPILEKALSRIRNQ